MKLVKDSGVRPHFLTGRETYKAKHVSGEQGAGDIMYKKKIAG